MPEVQWYYARNDQQFGPVSASELKQLADGGQLAPNDLLWREGMEAWSTAINLRGLFSEDTASTRTTVSSALATSTVVVQAAAPPRQQAVAAAPRASLSGMLRTTQAILWSMCVLVVLVGMILFTRAFLRAEDAREEAAAGAVFATFFVAAYVLARSGEKLSRILLARSRRRSR